VVVVEGLACDIGDKGKRLVKGRRWGKADLSEERKEWESKRKSEGEGERVRFGLSLGGASKKNYAYFICESIWDQEV